MIADEQKPGESGECQNANANQQEQEESGKSEDEVVQQPLYQNQMDDPEVYWKYQEELSLILETSTDELPDIPPVE